MVNLNIQYSISTLNIHWKDWCGSWSSNTLATRWEEPSHRKSPWCWERLKAGGEGDNREWGGWMASRTPWAWVWANSGRQWRTGEPDVLQSMGSQSDTTKQLNNNNNEVLAVALKQWFWKELQHYQESKAHKAGTQTGLPHTSQSLSSWSQLWLHISCPHFFFFFYCFQHKLWRLWISTSQFEYDHHIPA